MEENLYLEEFVNKWIENDGSSINYYYTFTDTEVSEFIINVFGNNGYLQITIPKDRTENIEYTFLSDSFNFYIPGDDKILIKLKEKFPNFLQTI